MTVSRLRRYIETLAPRPGLFVAEEVVAAAELDPAKVRAVAHVQKLAEISRVNARIVSAERLTNADLLRDDCEQGARLWIVDDGVDVDSIYPGVAQDLGGGVKGIYPPDLLAWNVENRPDRLEDFAHMDTVRVPAPVVDALDARGVPTRRGSALSRLVKNPQTLVYLVVFVYSSLRALPVVFVKEFHGSVLLLWTIDIVTAVPYTWGVLAMVLGKRRWERALGALTTIVTFMAPYIYFWMHGSTYPWYVTVIVAFLIFTGVAIEIAKYVQERSLERRYSQSGHSSRVSKARSQSHSE